MCDQSDSVINTGFNNKKPPSNQNIPRKYLKDNQLFLLQQHSQNENALRLSGFITKILPKLIHFPKYGCVILPLEIDFIQIVQAAINNKDTGSRGGFTSVGGALQSVGSLRNTSWPLSSAIIYFVANHCLRIKQYETRSLVAHFYLYLAQLKLDELSKSIKPSKAHHHILSIQQSMDMIMKYVENGGIEAKLVLKEDLKLGADLEKSISKLVQELSLLSSQYRSTDTNENNLPILTTNNLSEIGLFEIQIDLNTSIFNDAHNNVLSIQDITQSRDRNLGQLNILDLKQTSILEGNHLQWFKNISPQNYVNCQLALKLFEEWIFDFVIGDMTLLNEKEIEKLQLVLMEYRKLLNNFFKTKFVQSGGCMKVELRSREVVITWAMYCLIDHAACDQYPLVKEYGVSLDYTQLQHMVLSDKHAVEALLAICSYLQTRIKNFCPLFSLNSEYSTNNFAQKFASKSKEHEDLRTKIENEDQKRINEHWCEVKRMKKRVQELVSIYEDCKSATAKAKQANPWNYRRFTQIESEEKIALRQLEEAKKAPPPVIQPLPCTVKGKQIYLFYLYPPPLLASLMRLSFMSQQCLLPRSEKDGSTIIKDLEVETLKFDIKSHYNEYCSLYANGSLSVAFATRENIPRQVGPCELDRCFDENVGIWYPSLNPTMQWCGGEFQFDTTSGMFDPFTNVSSANLISYYSAKLSTESLQWAIEMPGQSHRERGNRAFSTQNKIPRWLSRPEYFAFCSVRSFPELQYRKIACAISDRTLPFEHHEVRLLIRQAFFHVGVLKCDQSKVVKKIIQEWQWDLENGEGFLALVDVLTRFVDELKDVIRIADALLFCAESLSYLCQWCEKAHFGRRACADVFREWAHLQCLKIESLTNYSDIKIVQAKREDIENICQFAVLSNHDAVFNINSVDVTNFVALQVRAQRVLCERSKEIVARIDVDPSILTKALRTVISYAPCDLKWSQLENSACYQAESLMPEHHIFNINTLTGVILVDGSPSRSLPSEILSHGLYQRTFGDVRNFEVTRNANGLFSSIHKLAGYYYSFYIHDNKLLIKMFQLNEFQEVVPSSLRELLDGTEIGSKKWASQIPLRLIVMHSHWLCCELKCVIFQPLLDNLILEPRVSFIALTSDIKPYPKLQKCDVSSRVFRVPKHLQMTKIEKLIEFVDKKIRIVDSLVIWEGANSPLFVFKKFESLELIHCYWCEFSNRIKIEIPRYELEFHIKWDDQQKGTQLQVMSMQFLNYFLSPCQSFVDTLVGFSQYLVLYEPSGDTTVMVTPKGVIKKQGDKITADVPDNDAHISRECCSFVVHHQFNDLRAKSLRDRLQLAAMYASTSCLRPEPRTGWTGAETALRLLRGCKTDHPLSVEERKQLRSIPPMVVASPSVVLMCKYIELCAERLSFLHEPGEQIDVSKDIDDKLGNTSETFTNAATAYSILVNESMGASSRKPLSPRLFLTNVEEQIVLGTSTPIQSKKQPEIIDLQLLPKVLALEESIISFVKTTENKLSQKVNLTCPTLPNNLLRFPLKPITTSGIELEMFQDLEESFNTQQNLPQKNLSCQLGELKDEIGQFTQEAQIHKNSCEAKLKAGSDFGMSMNNKDACLLKMNRALNHSISSSPRDWVEYFLEIDSSSHLDDINPFLWLSKDFITNLRTAVVSWLELSIFLDKMARLNLFIDAATQPTQNDSLMITSASSSLSAAGAASTTASLPSNDVSSIEAEIIRELLNVRLWEPSQHLRWLALETDLGLQIRPAQFKIAQAVLKNNGDILQLNMGEGKTRVIVPMIVLELAAKSQTQIPRVILMSHLFREAFEYMQEHLTGGLLNLRLGEVPFVRDIELSNLHICKLNAYYQQCLFEGIPILTTPESICSFRLKLIDIKINQFKKINHNNDVDEEADEETMINDNSIKMLESINLFHDVVDESDEVLKHKYQLVYAIGDKDHLPSCFERTAAVDAVLNILYEDERVNSILARDQLAVSMIKPSQTSAQESFFENIRFIPGNAYDQIRNELLSAIVEALFSNLDNALPFGLFKGLENDKNDTDLIKNFILNIDNDSSFYLDEAKFPKKSMHESLLALRGLLGFGLLEHCLKMRHRVDYGCTNSQSALKRTAVPFRAADMPAPRAEFAHADVVLVLTTLSYRYQFLSQDQLMEAIRHLLTLGQSAQSHHYDQWCSLKNVELSKKDFLSIDSVRKLDISNSLQMKLVYQTFSRNRRTIYYWLQYICFPKDMVEFPSRVRATAWHLAETVPSGFSGTNDLYHLLPRQVKQVALPDEGLIATNGYMLSCLLKFMKYDDELLNQHRSHDHTEEPIWKHLLKYAVTQGHGALIDAGAYIAGVSQSEVVSFTLELLRKNDKTQQLQGVVVFDVTLGYWMVHLKKGKVIPLLTSPVRECDTFVIFGERHCRGADMKLRRNCKAILTLGPDMCKDKLMQAAGRLRRLGKDQTITAVSIPAVHLSISNTMSEKVNEKIRLAPANILQWVMNNTVNASRQGLREWGCNGVHYTCTFGSVHKSILPEKIELTDMYANAAVPMTNLEAIQKLKKSFDDIDDEDDTPNMNPLYKNIIDHLNQYNSIQEIVIGNMNEECERELELEQEEEEENEIEIALVQPSKELGWDWNEIFNSFSKVKQLSNAMSLRQAVSKHLVPESLMGAIDWSSSCFVTSNYLQTVFTSDSLNHYLRPVDSILIFTSTHSPFDDSDKNDNDNEMILLISDYEANEIVKLFRNTDENKKSKVKLVHLSFARGVARLCQSYQQNWFTLPLLTTNIGVTHSLPEPPTSLSSLSRLPNVPTNALTHSTGSHNSIICPPREQICPLSSRTLISIQLFNGESSFKDSSSASSSHRIEVLTNMLSQSPKALAAAVKFTEIHSRYALLSKSDLEEVILSFDTILS